MENQGWMPSGLLSFLMEKLSTSSVKRYISWIKKILDGRAYNVDIFKNYYKSITDDDKEKNDYSSLLAVVKKVLEYEKQDTTIYNKLLEEAFLHKKGYVTASQTDKNNEITVDDIYKLREDIEKQKSSIGRDYKLQFLYFITELSPFRTQDYITPTFDITQPNHINIDNKTMVITEGKSINSTRTIKLPDKLFSIIVENKKKYDSPYLFPKLTNINDKMKTAGFTLFINRLFKRKISTSRLRQVFVSHYNDIMMNKKDRIQKAKEMGHTYETSQFNYTKYSKIIHEKDELIKQLYAEIERLKNKLKHT
jgi:hypothetical protein